MWLNCNDIVLEKGFTKYQKVFDLSLVIILVITHLLFLHETGSSNPIGTNSNIDKLLFSPYFILKDTFLFLVFIILFFHLIIQSPNLLGDPENFIPANPLVTPPHIQPE